MRGDSLCFFSLFFCLPEVTDRAGSSLVLHKDSPRQEAWNKLKETNPVLRSLSELRQAYDQSENPVVSSMRSVTQTVGSWFDENETAQVMRMMKVLDPAFNRESFERELREYIVPEVVDAYLSADQEALKAWCGEAASVHLDLSDCLSSLCRHTMSFGLRWSNIFAKASSVTAKFLISDK